MGRNSGGGGATSAGSRASKSDGMLVRPTRTGPVSFLGGKEAVDKAARKIFGRALTDRELASLAGSPDGATVSVTAKPGGNIEVTWHKDQSFGVRTITRNGIKNEVVEVAAGMRGRGFGTKILGRQVEMARKLGIKTIKAEAARQPGMVGYKVWPRLGFDAPLSGQTRASLPSGLRGAKRVSDLMKTASGRSWWDSNGTTTNMTFSTKTGSHSMRVLEARIGQDK